MSTDNVITVFADHKLMWQGRTYACALGKGGVLQDKREGDGATPVGRFKLKRVLYRPDRLKRPETTLNVAEITKQDGWCDDPTHADYNRPVTLPFVASHEVLWRDDHIYNVIVVMGHNDDPPVPYKGSAVFFHLARPHFEATEGCVAVTQDVMLKILKSVTEETVMEIRL
ncbi:L,D-transpeptidase family protein [Terasakiella sp. A23]|uniref:L,D-transpeptidase family protein n=1 Tax=Terasakiella sp. FCG-A23 TaxID=3080561 RepID=UPI002952B596|nr:L,D-transpeptidase family protein [Terasakiella sp. A23]MDV7339859.1 L,D-transpeptidase family protein [Terasakiella sp. A23]